MIDAKSWISVPLHLPLLFIPSSDYIFQCFFSYLLQKPKTPASQSTTRHFFHPHVRPLHSLSALRLHSAQPPPTLYSQTKRSPLGSARTEHITRKSVTALTSNGSKWLSARRDVRREDTVRGEQPSLAPTPSLTHSPSATLPLWLRARAHIKVSAGRELAAKIMFRQGGRTPQKPAARLQSMAGGSESAASASINGWKRANSGVGHRKFTVTVQWWR